MHSPSRAARKSLQMPCPPSEAPLPFSSTSLHHPCPSVHLPSTHQWHLNSPLSQLSKTFTFTYHLYYHILSVSAQASKRDLCPKQQVTTNRVYEAEPSHGHTQPSMQG